MSRTCLLIIFFATGVQTNRYTVVCVCVSATLFPFIVIYKCVIDENDIDRDNMNRYKRVTKVSIVINSTFYEQIMPPVVLMYTIG